MPRPSSRPGDLTGRLRDEQARANAEELAKREGEISVAYQAEQEALLNEVTDLTQKLPTVLPVDEVEEIESAEAPTKVIVLIEDLENVTIGAGNLWSFTAGKKYLVPQFVADHLTEKGYVR